MNAKTNQPDWAAIAEKFDVWLPQIEPVGEALMEVLNVRPGERVLDVASGTGEPALTLARRMMGSAEIIGTDSAEPMAQVAQGKVEREGLANIRFQAMAAESLDFADASFDKVLCRFGVMLFEDPQQGLNEMCRVLKPGGSVALAVWGTPETMPTMYWSYQVLKDKLPEALHPPVHKVTSLGAPGLLEEMMAQAGFADIAVVTRAFDYRFPSFDAFWDTLEASDVLKQQYDALSEAERRSLRDEVGRFARDFITDEGLVVPHQYLLATARRS